MRDTPERRLALATELLDTAEDTIKGLKEEREILIYWLLRAYHSGHREGWEAGPSTDETMDGLLSVLANRGYDPNLNEEAKELLKKEPRF